MGYKLLFTPLNYLGEVANIILQSFYFIFRGKINLKLTIEQMALIGVNSLPIVLLTVSFTGMVIALQTASEAVRLGGGALVGGAVAIAMARELAPVLVGVVVAGRGGSAIAAELGSMKVTEQIDALHSMAVHPIYYLVVPRILACIFMLPVLTVIANVGGISGGYFIAVYYGGVSSISYYQSATTFLKLIEFVYGLIKSCCFGLIISSVSCHKGLTAAGGAQGVGRATTNSVVLSIVFIFIVNYFLSIVMFGGRLGI